ncbi:MAG: co-chaperone DjlA, partial [Gammaproteobacteria bacterium]
MAWWGKVVGGAFGFLMGGPLGAALGTAIGHGFDRGLKGAVTEQEQIQAAFFTATFSVM